LRCITDQKTSRSQPVRTDSGDDRNRWRKQVFLNKTLLTVLWWTLLCCGELEQDKSKPFKVRPTILCHSMCGPG